MGKYQVQALSWQEFEQKVTRTAPLLVPDHSVSVDNARPLPESYEDYARVYGDIAWVYRCVARIAQTCASVPLEVYRRGSDGGTTRADDVQAAELSGLLEFANEFEALPDLIEQTATYLNLTGNAFWGIERDERDRVAELWCLRPDRVRIKPDRKRYIAGYVYEVAGRRVTYDTRDMVHIKYVSPADDYYGMGPLRAAMHGIVLEYYGTTYNKAMLRHHGMPVAVLKTKEPFVPREEQDRIRRDWQRLHGGPDKAGKIAILTNDVELTPIGLSPDELQWVQTRKMTREEIAAVFGVPPIMMGLYEGVNYATAQQQEKMFWSATVKPALEKIAAALNERLAPQIDPGLRVRFDLSGVEPLQADKQKETERVLKLVQQRVITPNEARRLLRIDGEVAGGDAVLAPGGLVSISDR